MSVRADTCDSRVSVSRGDEKGPGEQLSRVISEERASGQGGQPCVRPDTVRLRPLTRGLGKRSSLVRMRNTALRQTRQCFASSDPEEKSSGCCSAQLPL